MHLYQKRREKSLRGRDRERRKERRKKGKRKERKIRKNSEKEEKKGRKEKRKRELSCRWCRASRAEGRGAQRSEVKSGPCGSLCTDPFTLRKFSHLPPAFFFNSFPFVSFSFPSSLCIRVS